MVKVHVFIWIVNICTRRRFHLMKMLEQNTRVFQQILLPCTPAGLFEPSHMQYELDRDNGPLGEPSLKDMTRKAIEILQRGEEGFVLMVEGI